MALACYNTQLAYRHTDAPEHIEPDPEQDAWDHGFFDGENGNASNASSYTDALNDAYIYGYIDGRGKTPAELEQGEPKDLLMFRAIRRHVRRMHTELNAMEAVETISPYSALKISRQLMLLVDDLDKIYN